jgi:hypothetical protein
VLDEKFQGLGSKILLFVGMEIEKDFFSWFSVARPIDSISMYELEVEGKFWTMTMANCCVAWIGGVRMNSSTLPSRRDYNF